MVAFRFIVVWLQVILVLSLLLLAPLATTPVACSCVEGKLGVVVTFREKRDVPLLTLHRSAAPSHRRLLSNGGNPSTYVGCSRIEIDWHRKSSFFFLFRERLFK